MQESNDKVIYDVKKDLYLWPTGTKLKLSDNFSTEEFNSPRADMQQISGLLVEKLQRIRNEINMPLTITSGYRSSAYQQALRDRGYPTTALGNVSQHELGRAVDVTCGNMSLLLDLASKEFLAIGVSKDFLHLDLRNDKKRRWFY